MLFLTCLAMNLSAASGGSIWYNQVQLTLTNNCTTNVDLNNAEMNFQSIDMAGKPVTSFAPIWTYPYSSSEFSQLPNNTVKTIIQAATLWDGSHDVLAPGKKIVLNFGMNLNGTAFNYTTANSTLKIGAYTPTPTKQGFAIITLGKTPFANGPKQIVATFTDTTTKLSTPITLTWGSSTKSSGLAPDPYVLSLPQVSNGTTYSQSPSQNITIVDAQTSQMNVEYSAPLPWQSLPANFAVSGLTSGQTSQISFSDQYQNTFPTISAGNGSYQANFPMNDEIKVTATATGMTSTINPSTFTVPAQTTPIQVSFAKPVPTTGGKIIGYLAGWKNPPTAAEIAAAGYTHVLVAFGVFGTGSQAGQIVPAFSTVTKSYITSLKANNIKVLLSLGGASTSIANTTVNFHDSIIASTPNVMIASIEKIVSDYGFDGVDFDIEFGLGDKASSEGTFANPSPTGDIGQLSYIINKLHADNSNLLITLVPQTQNIAPNQSGVFGVQNATYSSLIMQTYSSLAWVAVQLYNTGGMWGIDGVLTGKPYDVNGNTPDFSVAMATALLENWPQDGSYTYRLGFSPFVGHLRPDQVVLGYPAGTSASHDANPLTSATAIKNAILCLRTGVTGCNIYIPSAVNTKLGYTNKNYPNIGGVFEWELSFDQANQFHFANDLKKCVLNGDCSS